MSRVKFIYNNNGTNDENDKVCCYPPEFIQRVLRWKSEAWKGYVRDLIVTAINHNLAMLQADTMPQL